MRDTARYRTVLAKFGTPPDQTSRSESNSKLSQPTRHRPEQIQTKKPSFFMMIALIYFFGQIFQNDLGITPKIFVKAQNTFLQGLGYREQALQVAKGALFQSEEPTGISLASFAGDVNIFIKGAGFAMNAPDNQIRLSCVENPSIVVFPLLLSEDDVFNSHAGLGILTYRVPSLSSLLGLSQDKISMFNSLTFILDIVVNDEAETVLACSNQRLCTINFIRIFTPIIHYISPPVTYFESVTQIAFDPQQVPSKIINLTTDSKPFVTAKIAATLLDFEFIVDDTTVYGQWYINYARGVTGAAPIGNNQNITMNWEVGASLVETVESVTCDINNENCYKAKTIPAIFDMTARQGFTTGGQNLTVYGQGFDGQNLTASVDGQPCLINKVSATQFSCIVSPSASVSNVNLTQPGGYGAKRRIFNNSKTWIDLGTMKKMVPQEEHLHTNFETPSNLNDFYGSSLTAFFVPPLTTRYRFYVACDEQCDLTMGLDPANPLNQTRLLTVYGSAGRKRNFWSPQQNQTRMTDWFSLTANQSYFIQAYLAEWSGDDYLSVGVEIEQSKVQNHINSMKEVQYLQVLPDTLKDTVSLTVTITDTTTGSFQLGFTNKANGFMLSGSIPVRASASQVRDAVWTYYTWYVGCAVDVNLTMYDSNGTVTTNSKNATVFKYYLMAAQLLPAVSSTAVSVSKATTATIQVGLPSVTQVSSTPLSGKFQIQCVDSTGFSLTTYELNYNAWVETIRKAIDDSCPMFTNKVQVMQLSDGDFRYRETAIGLQLLFTGYNDKPGQFKILTGNITSLKADNIVITNNVSYAKNDNIFYPAIPFELLRTVETKPQLLVQVGNFPAACHNLTCDYTYIQPTGSVSSFTFDESINQLTIQGVGLPNSTDNVQSIEYAKSLCEPTSVSDTQIKCTLIQSPTCGSFYPRLISNFGQIPLDQGVSNQTVSCVRVTSIVPAQSINLLGGDNLTLNAINFPVILKYSDVSITFNDSQKTQCEPQSSDAKTLVCLTNKFDMSSAGQTVIPSITINNIHVENDITLTLRDKVQTVASLTPSSASPVLKSQIVIQLPADFPYTVQRQDFTVNATNQTNPSYIRYMNVIGANDTTKTITVMFGGAWSGKYDVWIRHAQEGLLDTSLIVLDVSGSVTSISPKTGSIYGGTLLTIKGSNFGNVYTDNPVQLQMAEGGVGNLDCFVQTTNSTTITCILGQTITTTGKVVNTLVFLKTSEEAKCLGDCKFTFTDAVPSVTSMSTNWDASSNQYQVSISGSSFNLGQASDTKFQVNGVAQPLISMNDTQALFTIQNVSGSVNQKLHFYLSQGFPTGESEIIGQSNFTLSPQLVSITPNAGSVGGTILVANIQGVGPANNGNVQLKLANGTNICSQVMIPSYGKVICITLAKEIPASSAISVSLGAQTFACSNSDLTQCVFQQLKSDSTMPAITAATLSASSITFTGSNFPTSGYNTKAKFSGVEADSVTVSSATTAVATWNLGVPITSTATVAELRFESQTNLGSALIANPNSVTLTNTLTISSSNAASLSCSFAGGCNLQIQANGLSTVLQGAPQNNSIQVCGTNCEFQAAASSASNAVCKLPAVSTLYSNKNFNVSTQSYDLKPSKVWGNMKNVSAIFDGNNLNSLVVIGQSAQQCIIGAAFKEGQVGYLSQVKLFQNVKVSISTFIDGKLKLQASSDNTTWIDLWQADNNYHEGWNYITFSDPNTRPNYRFYRVLGADWGSCGQSEIKFAGVETVYDSSSTYKCPVKVIFGSTNITLSDQVTFDGSITPLLTDVNPRYGTVTGGDSVTFTGVGFSANTADYTITLDGINCPVTAASSTSVTCTTGKRPGLIPTSTVIYLAGQGLVSTQGLVFTYANFWSNDKTWGGEFAPMEGETVYIPSGLNLVIDVDRTPRLNTVLCNLML